MKVFIEILKREISLIFANISLCFLVFVFPLMYGLFLGEIYSEKIVKKIPIAVYDKDNSKLSRLILNYIQSSRTFNIVSKGKDLEEIKPDLRRENIVAFVDIPKGFQNRVKKIEPANITMFVSGSNYMLANLTKTEMQTIIQTVSVGTKMQAMGKTLGIPKQKALSIANPISIEMVKLYNPWFNYLDFLGPGFWMAALHQIMLLLGCLLISREFERGTFDTLFKMAKGSVWYLFLGKVGTYFLIMLLTFIVYFVAVFPRFDVRITGSMFTMITYSALFILCSICFGLVLSTVFKRSINGLKGVLLVGAPAFLVSGYTWPLESMPPLIRWIAMCIPITPYINGYRKIYDEEGTFLEILPYIDHLLLLTIICIIVSYVAMKIRVKKHFGSLEISE